MNDKGIISECTRKLLFSRMRILEEFGFYGMLLMHTGFILDKNCKTIDTDGRNIYINPDYIQGLSSGKLDYMLMHVILHIVLQHLTRRKNFEGDIFDQACDIVVNSNLMESYNSSLKAVPFPDIPHLCPDNSEGREHTAEEVYAMILQVQGKAEENEGTKKDRRKGSREEGESNDIDTKSNKKTEGKGYERDRKDTEGSKGDEHLKWGDCSERAELEMAHQAVTAARLEKIREDERGGRWAGKVPEGVMFMLNELTEPKTDWRTILNAFIQEEITDYSFTPPDRRFGDSEFFLPDFNEKDIAVKNILFMIDTSGSMSIEMITEAYSEVKGAIDQFNGRLEGKLGFFDAEVIPPVAFTDEDEFVNILPRGRGGTSFENVFKYISENMADDKPASIIILTDGFDAWPPEEAAEGVPVLWMINNNIAAPPWGRVIRLEEKK